MEIKIWISIDFLSKCAGSFSEGNSHKSVALYCMENCGCVFLMQFFAAAPAIITYRKRRIFKRGWKQKKLGLKLISKDEMGIIINELKEEKGRVILWKFGRKDCRGFCCA